MEPSQASDLSEEQPAINGPQRGEDGGRAPQGQPQQYVPPSNPVPVQHYPPLNSVNPQYPGVPIAYQPLPMRPMMPQMVQQPAFYPLQGQPNVIWTRVPQLTMCPYCQQNVTTAIVYNHCSSSLPWITCLGLFCSGCCWCCWVPFLCESCKDVVHVCSICRRPLGKKGMM